MYVLISERFASVNEPVTRPGPQPACTDAELLTMAVVGECCGWDQETVLLSQWRQHRDLFPRQPDRTRFNPSFNRRRRALAPMLNRIRQAVLAAFDQAQTPYCIIDNVSSG